MKTHAQHPVNTSRTLSGSPKASNQISMNELLQRGPVTQRMVGFEFQTVGGKMNVVKKKVGGDWIEPGHGEEIMKLKSGIDVTTDGYDLEFITPAVDERDDSKVSKLAKAAKNAFTEFKKEVLWENNPAGSYIYKKKYKIYYNGQQEAHPQATVGVKLENIIDLMDSITNIPITTPVGPRTPIFGHSTFFTQNTSTTTDNTNDADKQRQAVIASVQHAKRYNVANLNAKEQKQAQGLIALIEHFIKVNEDAETYTGRQQSNYHANAKNKMPVMPRTSIIDMFRKLEQNAQSRIIHYLNTKNVTATVMSQGSGTRYTVGELISDLNSTGNNDNSILFSKEYHAIGRIDNSISNRTTDKSTDIGYDTTQRVEGGIFELRSLPNQIAPEQWGNVVTNVAQVIKKVNAIRPPTS